MDQEKRTTGAIITAVIMFFCAFIFLCLGAGMAFSYPDKIWILGVILLVCCAVMINSGISNIQLSKNIQRDSMVQLEEAVPTTMLTTPGGLIKQPLPTNQANILAKWNYSKEEWQQFLQWEKKERKSNSTIEAIALVVLGTILIRSLKDTSWGIAAGVSLFVGIIYWLGKYFLSIGSIGKAANNEVVITNRSVIINGKVNTFIDGQYSLRKVSIKEDTSPAIIEFVYSWQTRNANRAEDEIRVPVPKGKLTEARELVRQF